MTFLDTIINACFISSLLYCVLFSCTSFDVTKMSLTRDEILQHSKKEEKSKSTRKDVVYWVLPQPIFNSCNIIHVEL